MLRYYTIENIVTYRYFQIQITTYRSSLYFAFVRIVHARNASVVIYFTAEMERAQFRIPYISNLNIHNSNTR